MESRRKFRALREGAFQGLTRLFLSPALVVPPRELTMTQTRYWKHILFERIYGSGT